MKLFAYKHLLLALLYLTAENILLVILKLQGYQDKLLKIPVADQLHQKDHFVLIKSLLILNDF